MSGSNPELYVFSRPSLEAEIYIRGILELYIVPHAPSIGENFVLMRDKTRPHTANSIREDLEAIEV